MAEVARPRGRPAGATTEATKARLLRAAREVFAEVGYSAASTGEIVARAGVTPPVLYHHFASKAGVFAAATTEVYDAVVGRLDAALEGCTTFAESVDAIFSESVAMHADDPTMAAFIVSTPMVVSAHRELAGVEEQFRRTESLFERVVADTGGVPGAGPRESVRVLRMLVWGMTTLSASLPDAAEFGASVQALRSLVLGRASSPLP